jgi:GNAT superfamily N-acetyltransferase
MGVYSLPKSLPSADKSIQLVEKYKAFRLLSLQLSPEAFVSSYEREVAFPDETWNQRVFDPLATNIVAMAAMLSDGAADEEAQTDMLLREEWLASLTLIGPMDSAAARSTFKDKMWIASPTIVMNDEVDRYFALYAMYVAPAARRTGWGVKIVESAKEKALEMVRGDKLKMVLVVDAESVGARRTYEKGSFRLNHTYWFDDPRPGRSGRTEAAVMDLEIGGAHGRGDGEPS